MVQFIFWLAMVVVGFVWMTVSGYYAKESWEHFRQEQSKPKPAIVAKQATPKSPQPSVTPANPISKTTNQVSAVSAEKLRLELAFLDELYDKITNDVHPIFETAHHLRNDWPEEMFQTGKEPMRAKIKNLQERLNQEVKVLAPFLLKNFYLGDLPKNVHQESVTIMVDLIHEGDTLINRVDALGEITRTNQQFLMSDRERFSDKVTKWGDWIDNLKKTIQKRKSELLAT